MNEIDFLKQPSPTTTPAVDVTARVLGTIRSAALTPEAEKSPWLLPSASLVLALIMGAWAWQSVADTQDSLGALTAPFEVHLQ